MSMDMAAERIKSFGTTIFAEISRLAVQHQAINLGQGFPDFPAPEFIKQAAIQAILDNHNQYAPGNGILTLRQAIAEKMAKETNLQLDPEKNILVTAGATEAIYAAITALINPGDEVIVFEPFYDSYVPSITMAGGIPRYYRLQPPLWQIDFDALSALFNEKTKMIIVNTPQNPMGKVFSQYELQQLALLCQKHNILALVDEVYEYLTYDQYHHYSLAAVPSMAERTITISSIAKTFSVTGWKIGWAIAAPEIIQAIFKAHQFIVYCNGTPWQYAAVNALKANETYYRQLQSFYLEKRNYLFAALNQLGLHPIIPQGTYFIITTIAHTTWPDDMQFCRQLILQAKVAAIPCRSFYDPANPQTNLVRFAFCKQQSLLEEGIERLQRFFQRN
jgi:aspartate/methionine/tyrosine aminotransferase